MFLLISHGQTDSDFDTPCARYNAVNKSTIVKVYKAANHTVLLVLDHSTSGIVQFKQIDVDSIKYGRCLQNAVILKARNYQNRYRMYLYCVLFSFVFL